MEKKLTMKRGVIWKKSFIKINWSLGIVWRTWFWQVFGNWITSRTSISKELRGLEYVHSLLTRIWRDEINQKWLFLKPITSRDQTALIVRLRYATLRQKLVLIISIMINLWFFFDVPAYIWITIFSSFSHMFFKFFIPSQYTTIPIILFLIPNICFLLKIIISILIIKFLMINLDMVWGWT